MTKARLDNDKPARVNIRAPGTNADYAPVHYWRIAQWAMLRGGTFTARELHEKFGICESTCFRYARAWKKVFGPHGPVIRRKKGDLPDLPAPAKPSLAQLFTK